MPVIEERVSNLEKVLEEFIKNVGIEFNKLYNAQMRAEIEMKAFREQSERDRIALHNEMKAFKDEMKAFKDEMKEFKDEMKEFKDEMRLFREETKEEFKRKNKEWSNLAKKMGTIVEDLIAPALRPVIYKYFECDVKMEGQRMRRRKQGEDYEVDAITACEDKVFMVEVKSTPKVSDVDEIYLKSKRFFEFFSEYEGRKLIVIFGSIAFDESVIHYASSRGIYVMAWREWEYMDILNFQEISC